jgi:signal transduction histidine kinase
MQISERDLLITLFAGSFFAAIMIGFFLLIVIMNFRKRVKKHNEDIRLIFEIQEKERDRISRELHDGIGALLSSAKLHTGLFELHNTKDEITDTAKNIAEIIDYAVDDLRTMVRHLTPRNIKEYGWLSELNELCKNINKGRRQQIFIDNRTGDMRFNSEMEINLYRIVQELINNSLKHSGASKTIVRLQNIAETLLIEVSDNGNSFDPGKAKKGHGIKNIQSRLESLKGKMEIKTNEDKGASFIIHIEQINLE